MGLVSERVAEGCTSCLPGSRAPRADGDPPPRDPGPHRTPTPGHGRSAGRGVCTELTACPCLPSAQVDTPFYEEWWFLLVMALSSLVVLLLVAFALVLHGQNRKYRSCSAGATTPRPPPRRPTTPSHGLGR